MRVSQGEGMTGLAGKPASARAVGELASPRPKPLLADLAAVRRAGYAVFALQLAALLVWNPVEAGRLVQTGGFSGFYQSWYLIAHGI